MANSASLPVAAASARRGHVQYIGLDGFADQLPEQWLQRRIAVGVRPEHLLPTTDRNGAEASFAPEIEMLEPVGNEIFVNLRQGAQPLVARCTPQALPEVGAPLPLTLALPPGSLHILEDEGGEQGEGQRLA